MESTTILPKVINADAGYTWDDAPHPGNDWTPRDPAAYRRADESEGNRDLDRMHKLLTELAQLADGWLERHPVGCACPLCSYRRTVMKDALRDIVAISVNATMGAALLDCVRV